MVVALVRGLMLRNGQRTWKHVINVVNGVVEGAEFLGIKISDNKDYINYIEGVLKPIYELNKRDRTDEIMFNCEFVPKLFGDLAV